MAASIFVAVLATIFTTMCHICFDSSNRCCVLSSFEASAIHVVTFIISMLHAYHSLLVHACVHSADRCQPESEKVLCRHEAAKVGAASAMGADLEATLKPPFAPSTETVSAAFCSSPRRLASSSWAGWPKERHIHNTRNVAFRYNVSLVCGTVGININH
jgi:hypothetical protein